MQPTNAHSETPYQGKNSDILTRAMSEKGYTDPRWADFRQWIRLGRVVKKGQKSTRISRIRGRDDSGKAQFRGASVFNFEQTTKLEPRDEQPATEPTPKAAPTPLTRAQIEQPFPPGTQRTRTRRTPDAPLAAAEPETAEIVASPPPGAINIFDLIPRDETPRAANVRGVVHHENPDDACPF